MCDELLPQFLKREPDEGFSGLLIAEFDLIKGFLEKAFDLFEVCRGAGHGVTPVPGEKRTGRPKGRPDDRCLLDRPTSGKFRSATKISALSRSMMLQKYVTAFWDLSFSRSNFYRG
jgi:hypothetical protein